MGSQSDIRHPSQIMMMMTCSSLSVAVAQQEGSNPTTLVLHQAPCSRGLKHQNRGYRTQRITGGTLPSFQDIYSARCHRTTKKIIKELSHTRHSLFTPLPSRRWRHHWCFKAGTERLIEAVYLQDILLLNRHHYHASTHYPAVKLRHCQ